MGRKRTSKKKKYIISVDQDLMEKLIELEINRSLLFTDAAKEFLAKNDIFLSENTENEEKE